MLSTRLWLVRIHQEGMPQRQRWLRGTGAGRAVTTSEAATAYNLAAARRAMRAHTMVWGTNPSLYSLELI